MNEDEIEEPTDPAENIDPYFIIKILMIILLIGVVIGIILTIMSINHIFLKM